MKYFVLKPRGTDIYARASRRAMLVYAEMIEEENQDFAQDLRDWVGTENAQAVSDKTREKGCKCQTCEYEHKAWHEDKYVAAYREHILKIIEEELVRCSRERDSLYDAYAAGRSATCHELIRRIKGEA